MNKMSVSAKTALGAMITALSVVILIPSAVQVFVYTLPAMAGMLTMLAVVEIDKKWAIGSYVATSLIGLLFVANKEAVVYYVAFFGYYPVVKALLESKMPRVAEYILKFLIFNVSIVLSGVVLVAVVMGFIWWKSGDDLTIKTVYMLGCLMLLSYFSFVLMLCVAVDCWLDRRGDEVIIKRDKDNEEQEDEE